MSEPAEQVAATCPSCSPRAATAHEVLSTGGGLFTIRCSECGHVHKEEPPREERVERRVIVSQEGDSITATVDAPASETVRVGEEFVVETDEMITAVRITDLQVGDELRTSEATVEDVETFWTRAVDNVAVDVTIHPSDGSHDGTRSIDVYVPGDHEFVVGAEEEHRDEVFSIEGIVVRDDAEGYQTDKLDRRGDIVMAKDAKRVYARDETTDAWSAW